MEAQGQEGDFRANPILTHLALAVGVRAALRYRERAALGESCGDVVMYSLTEPKKGSTMTMSWGRLPSWSGRHAETRDGTCRPFCSKCLPLSPSLLVPSSLNSLLVPVSLFRGDQPMRPGAWYLAGTHHARSSILAQRGSILII
jgi:hypothetical protein